jgi:Sec-independent protein translocase protein TatA
VFGVGPQEVVIIVALVLVIFGPAKAAGMARDLGRWVNEARRPVEELKEELASSVPKETKEEAPHSVEERNSSSVAASSEESNDAARNPPYPEDKERASSSRRRASE